jgi:cyclopropane-fatty-acyl-phospholipid synthase
MKPEQLNTLTAPTFSSRAAPLASAALDRWALTRIHQMVATAPLRFLLWDGYESPPLSTSAAPLVGTIQFKNRLALFSWLWDPDLYFGETYMFGAVDVRGDLATVLGEIYHALGRETRRSWWLWQRSNDEHAARENVHRHYDLGNAFYERWLDREMAYTCAYFPTPRPRWKRHRSPRWSGLPEAGVAGRAGARSGLRLGKSRALHGAPR